MTTTTHQHVWSATIADPEGERVIDWQEAIGSLTVPVLSPILEAVNLPETGTVAAYLLDFARLPDGAMVKIARALATRHGITTAEVLGGLAIDKTMPIVAEGVTVSSCCGYITGREVEEPSDPGFTAALLAELAPLLDDEEMISLELRKVDAIWLMGALQVAVKHPGMAGDPLAISIATIKTLQTAVCPPGSALERLALMGWVGR